MGSKERQKIDEILQNLPANKRLFRINAGNAWTGKLLKRDRKHIILANPRVFHGAPNGWPDLCGFESIEVTPDMIGKKIAIFVGEEIKVTGRMSDVQQNFKSLVEAMGGRFEVIS